MARKPVAVEAPEPTQRWYRIERLSQYEYRLLTVDLPESATLTAVQDGKDDLPRNVTDRLAERAFNSSRNGKAR